MSQTVEVALHVRTLLDGLGLASFPKTSGGKGFHILVPLDRRSTYDDSRSFAELVAARSRGPTRSSRRRQWAKSRRHGVLIDANQNGMGKTIASVYSVRPHPGAPVSTPLGWDEVDAGRSTRRRSRWARCSIASSGAATSTPACSRRGSRCRRRSASSRKGADAAVARYPGRLVRSRRTRDPRAWSPQAVPHWPAAAAGARARARRARVGARRQAGRGPASARGLDGVDRRRPAPRPRSRGNFGCSARPILGPCAPAMTGPCASRLAPTKVWFDCFPSVGRGRESGRASSCSPPAGVSVFTTRAQKASPKHAVWECKTLNADHIRIGPFLIATNDPHVPTEQRGERDDISGRRAAARRRRSACRLTIRLLRPSRASNVRGAGLVEHLVEVAALRALDARRAAVRARARRDHARRVGDPALELLEARAR